MNIASIGIDLGKTTFHLVALGERSKVLVRKKFSRAQLLAYTANLPASLIGLEACAGTHFMGAALREQGAQGGAIAHSVCGKRVVNFTSRQGLLYGVEQYCHAPGKCSTTVLEVVARALTKHALNVHCGHEDVYGALDTGWIILFGKDAQQTADQALILRRVTELSLTPGMNVQDGFLTSHLERTFYKHESELIREFLGAPTIGSIVRLRASGFCSGRSGAVCHRSPIPSTDRKRKEPPRLTLWSPRRNGFASLAICGTSNVVLCCDPKAFTQQVVTPRFCPKLRMSSVITPIP